eukprot:3748490-Prymnesium_polylepis.1
MDHSVALKPLPQLLGGARREREAGATAAHRGPGMSATTPIARHEQHCRGAAEDRRHRAHE